MEGTLIYLYLYQLAYLYHASYIYIYDICDMHESYMRVVKELLYKISYTFMPPSFPHPFPYFSIIVRDKKWKWNEIWNKVKKRWESDGKWWGRKHTISLSHFHFKSYPTYSLQSTKYKEINEKMWERFDNEKVKDIKT